MPPAYSLFDYIYAGPSMDETGRFDNRIWFYIPLSTDIKRNKVTYLKFPFGAKEDEIEEVDFTGYQWTD